VLFDARVGPGAKVVPAGSGRSVTLYGVRFHYKLEGTDSDGRAAVLETEIAPGALVKPHLHTREDEISIIIAGTVGVRVGDEVLEAAAVAYLFKPRGVPHALWNRGDTPATVVEIVVPAGLERYFEEVEPVLQEHGPEASRRFDELADRYGIVVIDEWTDELEQTYNVKLNPGPPPR
jgi:quercetin dioxygenase-like cupin family protein